MTERDHTEPVPPTIADGSVRASVSLLRRNRDFRRLFFASVISLGGDWFLFVAINGLILDTTGRAIDVGLAILAQELAFFFASPWAGALADRLDRKRLMIGCDLARMIVCVAFLLVGPGTIWLAFPLLAILSIFAAPFDPASSAAIPNLAQGEDLTIANALGGSLWGTMLAVGAALGGVVATVFGNQTAFLVDAASFLISAWLLSGIRQPLSEDRVVEEHPSTLEATIETLQYAKEDDRVLSLIAVKAGFGLAAGVLALIPVFAKQVFHSGDIGFGDPDGGSRPRRARRPVLRPPVRRAGPPADLPGDRHRPGGVRRELHGARADVHVVGRGGRDLRRAPGRWLAVGALELRTAAARAGLHPGTRVRRRLRDDHAVARAVEPGAATISDSAGPRASAFILGGVAVAWAAAWWLLTRNVRRRPTFDDEPGAQPGPPD